MNKFIFGLLIIAAGTGVFFLLRQKKETTITSVINQEWILGKWKPIASGSVAGMSVDSNFSKYQFDFQKGGTIIMSLNDSVKADTAHYEWNKASELVWKEKATDTTGKIYVVSKLTPDSLQLRSADSTNVLFTKLK